MILCKEECRQLFLSNSVSQEQTGGVWAEGSLSARLLQVNMADPLSLRTASFCSSVPLPALSCILADRVNNKCLAASARLVFGPLSENPGQQQPNLDRRLLLVCRLSTCKCVNASHDGNIREYLDAFGVLVMVKWTQEAGTRQSQACWSVYRGRKRRAHPKSAAECSVVSVPGRRRAVYNSYWISDNIGGKHFFSSFPVILSIDLNVQWRCIKTIYKDSN